MKRFFTLVVALLLLTGVAQAKEYAINLKQGFVMTWDEARVKNLTTIECARTHAVESWGKWNAVWDGWTLDAGFAYDASSIDTVALLLGREFGTLGKYLPIDFPLKDKIQITIYPVGLYVGKIFDKAEWKACSGGAIIKLKVSF